MRSQWIISAALGISTLPAVAFAHGDGASFELLTDTYFVDIGYDRPFQVGEETLIDFSLLSVKKEKIEDLASFTKLTYSIHSGSNILHGRTITKPEFGKVFETITPEKRGNWTLTVDFISSDVSIFSTSFDTEILPSAKAQKRGPSTGLIFAAIFTLIGGAVYFLFR